MTKEDYTPQQLYPGLDWQRSRAPEMGTDIQIDKWVTCVGGEYARILRVVLEDNTMWWEGGYRGRSNIKKVTEEGACEWLRNEIENLRDALIEVTGYE
jgi:hypothetical protein